MALKRGGRLFSAKASKDPVVSTTINGEKVPNLVEWCYERIRESRDYKDSLVMMNGDRGAESYDYPSYLAEMELWAKGERRLPSYAENTAGMTEEDAAGGENQLWTALQTLKTAIDEKNFQLEHYVEGAEDRTETASKIGAVRQHEWYMNRTGEFFQDAMYKAMWRACVVGAVHHHNFDAEPDGRERIFSLDPLAFHWEPGVDDFDLSSWIEYSLLFPIPEAETEFGFKLREKSSNNESDYCLNAHKYFGDNSRQAEANPDKIRVHFMYVNDTTMITQRVLVMGVDSVQKRVDVQLPAVDESGSPISMEQHGISDEDFKPFVIEGGQKVYRGSIKLKDLDGNPDTTEILGLRFDESGEPITVTRRFRKYPNWRRIIFANNQIISDEENPYQLDFLRHDISKPIFPIPIFWIRANDVVGNPLGRSHVEIMLDMQKDINIAAAQIRMNGRLHGSATTTIIQDSLVSPEDPQEIGTGAAAVAIIKKTFRDSPRPAIDKVRHEPLPVHMVVRKETSVMALQDAVGINEMLVRGVAKATDPAKKTELLTTLAMRRMIPFFKNAITAMKREEEVSLSLFRQYLGIPVEREAVINHRRQNVMLTQEDFDGYNSEVRLKIEDSSSTRKQKMGEQIQRFVEQGGAAIAASDPTLVVAFTLAFADSIDIPNFDKYLKDAESRAQAQPQAEGQDPGGQAPANIVPMNAGASRAVGS